MRRIAMCALAFSLLMGCADKGEPAASSSPSASASPTPGVIKVKGLLVSSFAAPRGECFEISLPGAGGVVADFQRALATEAIENVAGKQVVIRNEEGVEIATATTDSDPE